MGNPRKNFARSVPAEHKRLDRFRTGNDEVFEQKTEQRGSFFIDEHMNKSQRTVIREMMQEARTESDRLPVWPE